MKKNIAIIDPASYSLPYDYHFISSLSQFFKIDFYCSRTDYNSFYIDKIKSLDNVNIILFNVSKANKIKGIFSLISMYLSIVRDKNKYSSINVMWSVFFPLEYLFFYLIRKKLIFTFHNAKPHDFTGSAYHFFKYISKITKFNLFVSPYTEEVFHDIYHSDRSKSVVLNHGYMPLTDLDNKLDALSQTSTEIQLIFWGNVKPYKGLQFLSDSLSTLKVNNVMLEVYGKFDAGLVHLYDYLLANSVPVVNGYVDFDFIYKKLTRENSLLVLPYVSASQSGIMFNCLAHTIPFVSSDTGETAMLLKNNGLSELVFTYGDTNSLLSSIEYYKKNKHHVLTVLNAIKKDYSWSYSETCLHRLFN